MLRPQHAAIPYLIGSLLYTVPMQGSRRTRPLSQGTWRSAVTWPHYVVVILLPEDMALSQNLF